MAVQASGRFAAAFLSAREAWTRLEAAVIDADSTAVTTRLREFHDELARLEGWHVTALDAERHAAGANAGLPSVPRLHGVPQPQGAHA